MNRTSDYSTKQIRTQLDYAASNAELLKLITSAVKMLFESAEHAARIAVVVLAVTLAVISLTKVVDSGTATAQYSNAISRVVVHLFFMGVPPLH